MFSLGTIFGIQVGDLVITAVAAIVTAAFLIATRKWTRRDWEERMGKFLRPDGKRGDDDGR